jgi:rhombotail lipoprotein
VKIRNAAVCLFALVVLSGCAAFDSMTCGRCRSEARSSSSLVGFLYPNGVGFARENSIPELRLPVRVGLAFIPTSDGLGTAGLEAARREEILERIRERFADRKFVSEIVVIPDYYLNGRSGFDNLRGVQRLYDTDILALVSYDQVTYRDKNAWSLGYITIVGAYVLKGTGHEVTTLMDLAVVDPASRSILLRAGGTDDRHGRTTAIDEGRESRQSRAESFDAASAALIENFDVALTRFESDIRAGKANVRIARSGNGGSGGGGALDLMCLGVLGTLLVLLAVVRRQVPGWRSGVRPGPASREGS